MTASDPTGTQIGDYQIVRLLGKGGIGAVYLAQHTILEQPYAVKVLLPEVSGNEAYQARFFREARRAASIRHPNVVGVVNAGKHEDTVYLVMEYVDGKSLKELMNEQEGKLAPRFAGDMAIQALAGLSAAHKLEIIHRDIKPDNIMVATDGTVKLTDFGLARGAKDSSERLTMAGQVMGTPAFMSPEQWDGKTTDHRTDIYSFGASLFTVLSGRTPYPGKNPLTIAKRVITEPVPHVNDLVPEVDETFSALVRRMMAKDPAKRFQTAEEALEHLKKWRSGKLKVKARKGKGKASVAGGRRGAGAHVPSPRVAEADEPSTGSFGSIDGEESTGGGHGSSLTDSTSPTGEGELLHDSLGELIVYKEDDASSQQLEDSGGATPAEVAPPPPSSPSPPASPISSEPPHTSQLGDFVPPPESAKSIDLQGLAQEMGDPSAGPAAGNDPALPDEAAFAEPIEVDGGEAFPDLPGEEPVPVEDAMEATTLSPAAPAGALPPTPVFPEPVKESRRVSQEDVRRLQVLAEGKEPPELDDLAGMRVGGFLLGKKLSRGTSLFAAPQAVVKLCRRSPQESDAAWEEMHRLASDAQALSHSHLARPLKAGQHLDLLYVGYEPLGGFTLKEWLRERGAASLEQSLVWMEQLCEAVATIHAAGVVHTNIKPTNIQVVTEQHVALTELGLPRRMVLPDGTSVKGSPLYMPLEQWRGHPAQPTSDLYSLGVTWFQMLVGRTPFLGRQPVDLCKARLTDDFFSPRQMDESIPEEVNRLILVLMAREPHNRLQRAEDLLPLIRHLAS